MSYPRYNTPPQQPYGPPLQRVYNPQPPSYDQHQGGYGQPPQPYSNYGLPPQQYGSPPPPQQYNNYPQQTYSQPSLYGSPPQGPYSDFKQQLHDEKLSYGQQPYPNEKQHAYSGPPPPGAPQGQPQPVIFRYARSGGGKTPMDTSVTDPGGQTILRINTLNKKHSVATDGQGHTICTFDWNHEKPRMTYRGNTMKTKEFLVYQKKPEPKLFMVHNGQQFVWSDLPNGDTVLYHESTPGRHIAIWVNPLGHVELVMFPEALSQGLLEPCMIAVFLLSCGKPFGNVSSGGFSTSMSIASSAAFWL